MPILGAGGPRPRCRFGPSGVAECAAGEKSLDFHAIRGAQDSAVGAEELKSIPLSGVVTGRDLNAAGRVQAADRETTRRRRRYTEIDYVASGFEQARQDCMAQHQTAGASVAAEDDFSGLNVRCER